MVFKMRCFLYKMEKASTRAEKSPGFGTTLVKALLLLVALLLKAFLAPELLAFPLGRLVVSSPTHGDDKPQ